MTPLIFICGPTCSGKSQLALHLAEKLSGEIVNVDSVQLYDCVNIGTAKPTAEELQQIPHHLVSVIPKGDTCTAGEYRRQALQVLESHSNSSPLIFVGGSGFYFRALEFGMFDVGDISAEAELQLEQWMEAGGKPRLHAELTTRDPEMATKIYPQDEYRMRRALGLMLSQGRTMTEINQEFEDKKQLQKLQNPILKLGLHVERESLRQRVQARTEKMIQLGLIAEVKSLLEEGLQDWAPMQSIGYREVIEHLQQNSATDHLLEEIVRNTMRLAKRQMTWFKKDKQIHWFNALDPSQQQWHGVEQLVQDWIPQ